MTTITIKNGKKLSRTSFNDLEELLDWAIDHFQDEEPLSAEILKEAAMARKEISAPNSTFRRVLQ